MKTLGLKTLFIAVTVLISSATHTFAADKTSEKAREAVENAGPNDWSTLAESAEMCLKKRVNMSQANEWIKKSILIDENEYNLSLKGDYHMITKEPKIACEYYLEAMKAAKENDPQADISSLQKKMAKARKQLYQSTK